jgi:hypothetical protein
MQLVVAMGFSYIQVMTVYNIFDEDVDSMICYMVEMLGTGAYEVIAENERLFQECVYRA